MKNEGIENLLRETFEGPEGNASWFTESKPGSGLFGTVDHLSFEEASVFINGATIAAHTDHTRYHLWASNQSLEGSKQPLNWDESWKIGAVTIDEWEHIKNGLHSEYRKMTEYTTREHVSDSADSVLLGALAHAAYHLGAIRQMVKQLK